ncbi:MAG: dockerin type I domain-containing protein, partial [Planctomycetota bacterium]
AIASTRQLFIEGGDNGATTTDVVQGVAVILNNAVDEMVAGIETGDRIEVNAASADDPLDLRHGVTASAQGVFATTTPADPRSDVGNEVFETLGVESIDVESGLGDDTFTVTSDVAFDINQTSTLLEFDGNAGDDKLEAVGSAAADAITVGDVGGTVEPIQVDSVEFIRVDGNDGDDEVSAQTSAITALNGGLGNDILFGGMGQDLLTGGPDVDQTFGGDGDDVLFSDQSNGSNVTFAEDGEILNGGNQDTLAPGDVCVQLGVDLVINCETLADGGGVKDVLTWLRAILISFDAISFDVPDPLLDPFDPTDATPIGAFSVTEPSQVPVVAALTTVSQPNPEPTDVNGDGTVSPSDALVVMNHVARNLHASGEGVIRPGDESKDVNRDGTIQLLDALIVINDLERRHAAEGEGVSDRIRVLDEVFSDEEEVHQWVDDAHSVLI